MTKAEATFEKYALRFPEVPKLKNFIVKLKGVKAPKAEKLKYNPSGERDKKINLMEGFIPGALATGVSTGSMYPIDTLQMRSQSGLKRPENVGEYYKGIKMKLVKAIPAGAIAFGLTPIFKKMLTRR